MTHKERLQILRPQTRSSFAAEKETEKNKTGDSNDLKENETQSARAESTHKGVN